MDILVQFRCQVRSVRFNERHPIGFSNCTKRRQVLTRVGQKLVRPGQKYFVRVEIIIAHLVIRIRNEDWIIHKQDFKEFDALRTYCSEMG